MNRFYSLTLLLLISLAWPGPAWPDLTLPAFMPGPARPDQARPGQAWPVRTPKPKAAAKINWLTMEQAYALNQKQPKKFVVDVYTDWCGWCKVMDRETFSKPAIADYVNKHFYPVKLNAEGTEEIKLGDRTYKSLGRTHELAVSLLNNQIGYPTTVFLDEEFNVIQPVAGYLEPRLFHQVVTYFGGNYNQKEPFEQFKTGTYVREFQPAMPPAGN